MSAPVGGGNTPSTAFTRLDDFVRTHGSNDVKLYARRNENNEVILFTRTEKRTFGEKLRDAITGESRQMKAFAKQEIKRVLVEQIQTTAKTGHLSQAGREALNLLMSRVEQQIDGSGTHALRGAAINVLTAAVKNTDMYLEVKPSDSGPRFSQLGDFRADVSFAASMLQDKSTNINDAADAFGQVIARRFLKANPDATNQLKFVASFGADFKDGLRQAIANEVGGEAGRLLAKSPEMDRFLEAAYNKAAAMIRPDNRVVTEKPTVPINQTGDAPKTHQVPNIMVGGVEYKPVAFLGEGATADVFKYQATDGSGDEIAFKLSKDNTPEAVEEMGREAQIHKEIYGQGHDNVVGIRDVIRTDDGRIGVALDLAEGGTLLERTGDIKNAIGEGPGKIPPKAAQLIQITLLQDLIKGMAYVRETKGFQHRDMKSPNCLVTDGVLKLSDFGMTEKTGTLKVATIYTPDNPTWTAPEILKGGKHNANVIGLKTGMFKHIGDAVKEQITKAFPKITKFDLNVLANAIMAREVKKETDKATFDETADTWSVGITALDLIAGVMFASDLRWMTDVQDRIMNFTDNPFNVAIGQPNPDGTLPQGVLARSTGNPDLDDLLNKLLDPVPDQRTKLSDALDLPVFDTPGIDSPEIRDLLKAIGTGNADQIDAAMQKLSTAFPGVLAGNSDDEDDSGSELSLSSSSNGLPPLPDTPDDIDVAPTPTTSGRTSVSGTPGSDGIRLPPLPEDSEEV